MLAFQRQRNFPSDESLMAQFCAATLRATLYNVTEHFKKFSKLANCHLVHFITEDLWQKYVPDDIRKEIEHIGLESASTLIWNLSEENAKDAASWAPCLTKYLTEAKEVSLGSFTDLCLPYSNLKNKLISCESISKTLPQLNQFMSPKKAHEVEIMSEFVATLTAVSKASHIVDVGSGKGYLTSMLALHHGLYILGVDSSLTNTHGAAERTQKLEKAWIPAIKKQKELQTGQCSVRHGKHWKAKIRTETSSSQQQKLSSDEICNCGDVFSLYKQATAFISEDTDLTGLVTEHFGNQHTCRGILLTGLHTCGNLAPSCLRLFAKDNTVSAVCNVGCCNHLLEERFFENPFAHSFPSCSEKKPGFPMSQFLTEKNFILGRNARMLSAQSLHRILSKKEAPNDSLWYRALLQVLLARKFEGKLTEAQVGRIAAKCQNFLEYVSTAFNKLGLTSEVTSDEIEDLCKNYKSYQEKLPIFFMLRAALAPVIETIILLDRLLYLHEQGITDAHLVQLFDPVVSPRCFALVAIK